MEHAQCDADMAQQWLEVTRTRLDQRYSHLCYARVGAGFLLQRDDQGRRNCQRNQKAKDNPTPAAAQAIAIEEGHIEHESPQDERQPARRKVGVER